MTTPMTPKLDEARLRELAEAATRVQEADFRWPPTPPALTRFHAAANPATILALLDARTVIDWKPIETAPDDQRWVLLLFDRDGEPDVRSGFRGVDQEGSPIDEWFQSEASSGALNDFGEPTHWAELNLPNLATQKADT